MKIFNNRKIKIHRYVLLATLAIASIITSPRAQQPAATTQQPSQDRVALYQALLDLTNPWTVMCVAAHPDDEDGTSLIVMRRKYGAHTVSLFSTFGEGGQNAIGPELYEELGAIRARETMAAAEIQGSEPHFLGLKDFGYSKSFDETFQKWGHEEALRRMVLQIRKLRPDVIITNHSVTSNDHGHHQATARLVVEAFDAAADANMFPEQLKDGVTVWQVQRLFVRARGNNQAQANAAPVVIIDPNERDPIRSTVYAEEALRALQKHATQGPWPKTFAEFAARFRAFSGQSAAPGQLPLIRYALMREAKGAATLPKDSHNFLDELRLPENLANEVLPPTINGKALTGLLDQRDQIANALAQHWIGIQKVYLTDKANPLDRPRLALFIARIIDALVLADGITTKLVGPGVLSPGGTASFSFIVSNNGREPLHLQRRNLALPGENRIALLCCPTNSVISPGKSAEIVLDYSVPKDARITVPHASHLYDDRVFGTGVVTQVETTIDGAGVFISASKSIDLAPALEIERITPSPLVLTPNSIDKPLSFTLKLINHESTALKRRLSVQNESLAMDLPPQASTDFQMTLPHGLPSKTADLKFTIAGSAVESATIPVAFSNAIVAASARVGYVRGFDFSLPNALNALGVESKELSVDEVKTGDLSKYTSFIVDNRVYESQPELIATNQKLLDYANAGGNLIVFYHKSDEWNPDPRRNRPQLAPYKLVLGNERVTDENAPITFIEPDHTLLNLPNKIGPDDFRDWIQERGLYYPREWDPQHGLVSAVARGCAGSVSNAGEYDQLWACEVVSALKLGARTSRPH